MDHSREKWEDDFRFFCENHDNDRNGKPLWDCEAHNEGQRCCLDEKHRYNAALQTFIHQTRKDAVAEAFEAIDVERKTLLYPYRSFFGKDNYTECGEAYGFNEAARVIEQKKQDYLKKMSL